MKKNVRVLAGALCFMMFAATLIGCSSGSTEKKDIVTTDSTEEETKVENSTEITIEEQVLFDNAGIVITAKEYVTDSIWGDGIKLLLENNSDKTVSVGCEALIVNDYMIADLFSSEVAAGKKANEVMYLSSSELEAAGIDSVGKVEVYFNIYDSATYETICSSDCVTIQTSEFANMDTTPDDGGTELYNEGGIRIIGKMVDENSFWGTAILLYCENTTEKNVGISVEEMSINGFMIDPFFSTTVYAGKKSLDEITIMSSDLETNGIEKIEGIELKFHIYDTETYDTITDSNTITFSVE